MPLIVETIGLFLLAFLFGLIAAAMIWKRS